MDYVTLTQGRVYLVTNQQPVLLKQELPIGPEFNVLTNGLIKLAGATYSRLTEGRKLTLDGFWWNEDRMLIPLRAHYLMKDRVLYFAQDGLLRPVQEPVPFSFGAQLRADGTVATPDQRVFRLQDGQSLSPEGNPLPALDHASVSGGRFVLQKDGSIIPLPAGSTISMTDGTLITGSGVITRPNGAPVQLREGQRVTLPGPAMPSLR